MRLCAIVYDVTLLESGFKNSFLMCQNTPSDRQNFCLVCACTVRWQQFARRPSYSAYVEEDGRPFASMFWA